MIKNTKKLDIFDKDQTEDKKAIGLLIQRAKDKKVEFIRSEGEYEEMKLCTELCIASSVSHDMWRQNYSRVPISKFITVADEAITLLILENNVKEWVEQVEEKETQNPPKKRRLTRYTGKGRKIDGTKKGWSLEGKKRYNEIFDKILEDRRSESSKSREKSMMKDWGSAMSEKDLRMRASAAATRSDEVQKEMERIREEDQFVPRTSFGVSF